jgi:hypothetical protein
MWLDGVGRLIISLNDCNQLGWKCGVIDRRRNLILAERCRLLRVIFGVGGGIVPFL